ncbi:hypothetical protein [Thiomicrorhabdus sp. Kp2]|uniref:hypothetical protein n=1 Tax=Thiomicrorhabdus sp. Kp2 TaxID=1123518 RepID=UPI0018E3D62A|nr:hypothetical protein [Thiomicrorhabdus sp. Kp2]
MVQMSVDYNDEGLKRYTACGISASFTTLKSLQKILLDKGPSSMQQVMKITITANAKSLIAIIGGLILITILGFSQWSSAATFSNVTSPNLKNSNIKEVAHHPREKTYMKRQWGVEILYVRTSAAGYMLEFRYKVLDPEKAKALFERQSKPQLTHNESSTKLIVPTPAKTGALRNSNPPLANHTYWMFFANPGKLVKPGEHVTIKIGDFLAERLIVQ